MINVLIVEDSKISSTAFLHELGDTGRYHVTAAIENAANAEIICMRNPVDLILMDVCTADDESGLAAAERIRKHNPDIKILIMTSMPEHSFLQKALEIGCDGFWYKELETMTLTEACDAVIKGTFPWPEQAPVLQIGLARSDEFTDRDLEVIRALAQGNRYEEIGEQLFMSTNTVKYHVKNILQKTGFHSTIQLVAEVVGKRLVLPNY